MSLGVEHLRAVFADPNIRAFYAVVRRGESSLDDRAYRMINGGGTFDDFSRHPFDGLATRQGGRAAGAAQFIPSTWSEIAAKWGLEDFTPDSQDLGYVACLEKRHAVDLIRQGKFEAAIAACRLEWTSLPGASENHAGWNMDAARALYLDHGGRLDNAELLQPEAPIEDRPQPPAPAPAQQQETAMPLPILALISAFGPMISAAIPAVAKLFDRKAESPEKVAAAQKVIETIVTASGSAGIDEALTKVQTDPAVREQVKAAVLAEPSIAPMLTVEIGGGIAGAREADKVQQSSDKPFYKTSAVFWISMVLLPTVYWYVGSSVVGGVDIPSDWPWYAQLPLKLFGAAWDSGARVGLANLIVGLVLGGICGVYYGISVTQNKQQAPTKEQA